MRRLALPLVLVASLDCAKREPPEAHDSRDAPSAHLIAIGPRLFSNQSSQPLAILGEGLAQTLRLRLGEPLHRDLPLTVIDSRHAYVRVPDGLEIPADQHEARVSATLLSPKGRELPGELPLTVVNDQGFPDLVSLTITTDGKKLFAASPTTDTLFMLDLPTSAVTALRVGDGPREIACWKDPENREWIVVAHEFSPELWLLAVDDPTQIRKLPAPTFGFSLTIDNATAYLGERAKDTVVAIDLRTGAERWRTRVDPNPRTLALAGQHLAIGSFQTGEVELLDRKQGTHLERIAPGPGVSIVGGRTARMSQWVMNGTAVRALVFSAREKRLLLSSIGPNLGPNPDRMEVSMNSGVAVLDPAHGIYERHLGFGSGITEGLALDDLRGLLFAADIGLGLVRIIDVNLIGSDAQASAALLQSVAIPIPDGFPTALPRQQYGESRAGVEMHSGPRALALSPDGAVLYVLNRFSGTIAKLDVREARRGQARFTEQISLVSTLAQPKRRLGQILYYADMGKTGITCDACHIEGHTGGLFFEKTHPLRVYRSTTVLGSRETPPYFTPASQKTLKGTASFVGGRNRNHNPAPSPEEVEALALFNATLVVPPNPFVGPDGAPKERLEIDQGFGNARRGLALFERKARCSSCHPGPLFTTDQDRSTRGQYMDVETPLFFPLREKMQELLSGYAPPSLLGAWDIFPMLTTATAGLAPDESGRVCVTSRFPLREIVASPHGKSPKLSLEEQNDLIAYLLSL